jgi:mono/diheme cytochrome c family protein
VKRCVLLLGLGLALCAADRKSPPWEKRAAWGEDLYRENCVVCHDVDRPKSRKMGPSLYHLFKNEKLPLSGGKPSREYVVVKVKFGGQIMPPFIKRLNDAEIAALVTYLESK